MITRAQDYQTITPVGVIDGGILPARDVEANGSAHTLRAEDRCFAIEAVNERNSVVNYTPSSAADPLPSPSLTNWGEGLDIVHKRLKNAVFDTGRAIAQSAVFASADHATEKSSLNDLVSGCVLSSCYSSPTPFSKRFVLNNDSLRRFYYDLQRSDRLSVADRITQSGSQVFTFHDEDDDYGTPVNYAMVDVRSMFDYRTRRNATGYRRRYQGLTSGNLTMTFPLFELAASADLVVEYHIQYYIGNDFHELFRVRKFQLAWDSFGVVTVPETVWKITESDMENLAGELSLVMPFVTTSNVYPTYPVLYVTVAHWWVIVCYDFRTEIRSLNWQWTPPAN